MVRKFCVRCGSLESKDSPIIDGLCPKCFVNERRIVELPNKVELTICSSCGALYARGRWVRLEYMSLEELLEYYINNIELSKAKVYPGFTNVSVKVEELSGEKAVIKVTATYGNIELSQEMILDVHITRKLCPRCFNIRSGAYEALIQVRFEGRGLSDINNFIARLVSNPKYGEYISEVKEVRGGYDIKVLSQSLARQLALMFRNEFGAKIITSWTNTSIVSGKRHSKLTISVRIPTLYEGDIIEVNGEVMLLVRKGRKYLILRRLSDWHTLRITYDELWSRGFKVLSEREYVLVKGKVLSYEGGKAVIQNIDTGEIHYMQLPKLKDLGSDVSLLIYKGKTYVLR